MTKRRTGSSQVHTITSAPQPLTADIDRRARRYLFQMGLRTFCFLAPVFTWGRVPTAVSVTLLIGAVVLPYVAVIGENNGERRTSDPGTFIARPGPLALPGPAPAPGAGPRP